MYKLQENFNAMKKFNCSLIIFLLFTLQQKLSFAQESLTQKDCIGCHNKTNAKPFIHEPSNESCKNCHQSTGKKHPLEDVEGFKLSAEVPALCYNCHDPINTKKHLHPPIKKGDCLSCHEVHSSSQKKLVFAPMPELCFFCHSDYEKRLDTAKVMHQVVKSGSSCLNCHSPHQSDQPKLLLAKQNDLCLKCHDKTIIKDQRKIANVKAELEKNKFQHSAIAANGCVGCHDPHAADQNNLLKGIFSGATYISGKSKDNIGLCFQCHEPALLEKEKVQSATSFRDGDKNLHFKHVNKNKGRNCVTCHGVHAAPNEFLLKSSIQFGQWEMPLNFTKTASGGKCITACHAPKTYSRNIAKKG